MLNWKKTTVKVKMKTPGQEEPEEVKVTGKGTGYWVVHRSLDNKQDWAITHAPTGLNLISLRSKTRCIELVEHVSKNVYGFTYMSLDRLMENKESLELAVRDALANMQ